MSCESFKSFWLWSLRHDGWSYRLNDKRARKTFAKPFYMGKVYAFFMNFLPALYRFSNVMVY